MRPPTLEQSLVFLQDERALVSARSLVLARAQSAALAIGSPRGPVATLDFVLAANASLRYLLPDP
ncbi:MAG TPA: hypothetical protein VGR28_07625 [Candidatus Thermoplasmatota archaeon]|jgi:hypothetical protein|nr:hypothetical protein [Candidatus Thermoplasmatota archaeon]